MWTLLQRVRSAFILHDIHCEIIKLQFCIILISKRQGGYPTAAQYKYKVLKYIFGVNWAVLCDIIAIITVYSAYLRCRV